ncbi:MAG: EVE domain-containing protein [Candidatus Puniceispirillum sp.]|nr:EVE domain-containing protein [Candidatus Pelagibacter sp.]MBA4283636.1 EVE domain-containing protein [Candidatus Puniceispirillum sp.]
MKYWLIKSEPDTWSIEQQEKNMIEPWDGVRNYQARNNIKAMEIGDLCFFYHSVSQRKIVGIVEVCSDYRLDPNDETMKFGLRDMKFIKKFSRGYSLDEVKTHPLLQDMALLKQSRLSVQPVTDVEWNVIMSLVE